MKQLPLEITLADYAVFDSFFVAGNGDLVHALKEASGIATRSNLWLWGAPGCGRTHLLQACVNAAGAAGFYTAYLPFGDPATADAAALEGMGAMDLLCLDDVDRMAGDAEWERAMFSVYESLRARGSRLIVSAERPPLHMNFGLPDLASRFAAAATFRVRSLDDQEKKSAMRLRASWRGLQLPDEVADYLLARVDRRPGELFALLDRVDREALAQQRKLTVPFVKSVLLDPAGNG